MFAQQPRLFARSILSKSHCSWERLSFRPVAASGVPREHNQSSVISLPGSGEARWLDTRRAISYLLLPVSPTFAIHRYLACATRSRILQHSCNDELIFAV